MRGYESREVQKMVQGITRGIGEPQWEVQGTDACASANCICAGHRRRGTTCGISAAMRG